MQHYDVPFYANPDKTHCLQACVRSTLKFFEPNNEYPWERLDKITDKIKGMSTWPQRTLINLSSMGYKTILIESFDYKQFILQGKDYLINEYGQVTANWQIKNSNIKKEQKDYIELLSSDAIIKNKEPLQKDIKTFLDSGYLVKATVNSKKLNNLPGYTGHSILIIGYDNNGLYVHDPGPIAQRNRYVLTNAFEQAWASPNIKAKELIAIKPKKKGFNNG